VRLNEPGWWYGANERPSLAARAIAPLLRSLSRIYGRRVEARYHRRQPYRSRYPVICVGNFVAGGTGKTPLALLIARLIIERNGRPVFLSRGYGGHERGPAWVREGTNAAWRFGDEPLLLARVAPTLVARDRKAGVQMIEDSGREVTAVIMDDGLQNPGLVKDLSIAVIDGARGLGNGEVIPAGPLRAPIAFQLGLVDAIVVRESHAVVGDALSEPPGVLSDLRHGFHGPVLAVHAVADCDTARLAGATVVAFAGIANPARFFTLVENLGASVADHVAFPDHHVLTRADAEHLSELAQTHSAKLITTEKDWVRLESDERLPDGFAESVRTLPIRLELAGRDMARLVSMIEAATLNRSYPRRTHPPQI
jgi:tetraacyldisaccharide 4'-kinase